MSIYRPVYAFFFNLFTSLHFCIGFVSDISVIYRYIGDIERFFPIFPRNDFLLQKSYCDGSTPEISMIYRRYFTTFLTLVVGVMLWAAPRWTVGLYISPCELIFVLLL